MDKIKEVLKEKSTWVLGVPSITYGVLTILKDDNAQAVTDTITNAGEHFANTGDWQSGLGYLIAGLFGILMRGR